eukprot:scpid100423/ scgid6295/ 
MSVMVASMCMHKVSHMHNVSVQLQWLSALAGVELHSVVMEDFNLSLLGEDEQSKVHCCLRSVHNQKCSTFGCTIVYLHAWLTQCHPQDQTRRMSLFTVT